MSTYVENQVVELEFDNRDFEKNVSTSLKTLETLKEKLKFENASKGFYEIQNGLNSINFTPFLGQLDDMESQFTSFMGRLELNIKDFLAGETIAKFQELFASTIGQIKSGGRSRAQNIEQAQFKIKGLEKDWNKVYEDMDYAVSGTAYGIDQAANAAAQFLASNVHTGEDMKAALRGISGIAAMTSSGYDEIARVFTAAAGKGRVMALELNRISLRGVNAAAALAKYLNTTEAQVRKLASEGQISFQTFANAMDAAFGEHAKKANETFAGSLANVRAALSRIGEIYYEPWIRSMIPFFNALRTAIDSVKNALKGLVGTDEEGNKVFDANNVAANLKNLLLTIGDLKTEIVKSFIPSLDGLTSRFDWLNEKLQNATITIRAITEAFKKYNKIKGNTTKKVEEEAKESTGVTSSEDPKFLGLSTQIAGVAITLDKEVGATVASIIDRYKALYDAQKSTLQSTTNLFSKWTYQYKTSFSELNKALKSNKWGLETLSKDMAKLEGKGIFSTKFIERLKSMGSSGAEIVHALANATDKDLKEYMQTWEQTEGMFDTISGEWTKDAKKQAEDSLNQITGIPQATMEDYMNTFGDMFKQLGISDAAGYSQGFLQSFESMETLYARQLDAIDEYNKKMQEAADAREAEEDAEAAKKNKYQATYEIIENYTERLYKAMTSNKIIVNIIDNMQQTFRDLFATLQEIGHRIYEIFEAIGGAYIKVWKKFNVVDGEVVLHPIQKLISLLRILVENFQISGERAELIKSTFKGVFAVFELVKWAINNLIDAIAPFLITLSQGEPIILRVTGALGEFVTAIVNRIINGEPIGDALDNLLGSIRGFFSGLLDLLKGDGKESEGSLGNILRFIRNTFKSIFNTISDILSSDNLDINGDGFSNILERVITEKINIEKIKDVLHDVFSFIKDGFEDIWNIVDTIITIIPDALTTAWGFIKNNVDLISSLFESIINFFKKIFDNASKENGLIEKIGNVFESICDVVTTMFKTVDAIIQENQEPINHIISSLIHLFDKFFEMMESIFEWVGDDVERAYGAAAFFVLMDVIKTFKKQAPALNTILDKLLPNLRGLVSNTSKFFKEAGDGIKRLSEGQTKDIFDKIRSLAISFLIFAASILIIAKAFVTTDNKISYGAIAGISITFVYLLALMAVMANFVKTAGAHPIMASAVGNIFRNIGLMVLMISVGLAIIAKAFDSASLGASGLAIGALALILIGVWAVLKSLIKSLEMKTSPIMVKTLRSFAIVIFAIGVAITAIINSLSFMMLTIALILKVNNKADMSEILAGAIGIIAIVLLAMAGILYLVSHQQNHDTAGLIGLSVFMITFSVALGIILGELVILMFVISKTKNQSVILKALGVIAAIMFGFAISLKMVAKAAAFGGSQMLAGLIGLSILIGAMASCMIVIAGLVVMFHKMEVTDTDVNNVLKIFGILALIIGIFTGVVMIGGALIPAGATALITALAVSIFLICSSFAQLAIAVGYVVSVFIKLAKAWPKIREILPEMLEDLDKLLPKMIGLIGTGIRKLAGEIIISAPIIAAAIFTVMTTLFTLMMQKAPAHALAILIVIDEILTIIVAGAGIIVNKLLFILVIVLEALNANAYILGYQLTMILIKVVQGAFEALVEVVVEGWKQIWDEVFSDWWKEVVENYIEPIQDAVTNWTWSLFHGESWEQTEANQNLKQIGDWYVDANGKMQRIKTEEDRAKATIVEMNRSMTDYKEKFDETAKIVDDINNSQAETDGIKIKNDDGTYTDNWDFESWKNNAHIESARKELMNQSAAEELKSQGYEIPEETVKAAENTGKVIGGHILNGESGALNSPESEQAIADGITDVANSDTVGNAAEESGGSIITKVITGATDKLKDTISKNGGVKSLANEYLGLSGDDASATFGYEINTDNLNTDEVIDSITNLTKYGDGTMTPALDIGVNTVDENGNPVDINNMQEGLVDQTANINVEDPQITRQNELLESLEAAVNTLNEKIYNSVIIPKDTNFNITESIDGKELGTILYPIMEAISQNKTNMEEAGVAH